MDLAKRNARVILACRSVERGETASIPEDTFTGITNNHLLCCQQGDGGSEWEIPV